MSSASEPQPLVLGIAAVQRLFEEGCASFRKALGESESAADAVDFTSHMHTIALAAGRVLALGEALAALTGDQSWNERAAETVRAYLSSDTLDL